MQILNTYTQTLLHFLFCLSLYETSHLAKFRNIYYVYYYSQPGAKFF